MKKSKYPSLPRKRKKAFIKYHNTIPFSEDKLLNKGSVHYLSCQIICEVCNKTKFVKEFDMSNPLYPKALSYW